MEGSYDIGVLLPKGTNVKSLWILVSSLEGEL
jgi:hypothetical protein